MPSGLVQMFLWSCAINIGMSEMLIGLRRNSGPMLKKSAGVEVNERLSWPRVIAENDRKEHISAKAARRQERDELASSFGGAPDTATVLRVFPKGNTPSGGLWTKENCI